MGSERQKAMIIISYVHRFKLIFENLHVCNINQSIRILPTPKWAPDGRSPGNLQKSVNYRKSQNSWLGKTGATLCTPADEVLSKRAFMVRFIIVLHEWQVEVVYLEDYMKTELVAL